MAARIASLPAAAVEVIAVSARYDSRLSSPEAALRDVSLTALPGEILTVIGPNGAGKSTLLRVLAGTLAPREGQVRLFGAPLAGLTRRDIARDVAFVMQSEEVRFSFSVRQVVLMGRAPHQGSAMEPSDEDRRIAADALLRCDLEHLADRTVDELSGGEKKRVAIARAFAQSTRVLLLDEPTASLDVPHQVALFEHLREATEGDGKTCIVVTHDIQLAAAHATRVAILKAGRLIAQGPSLEVLDGPHVTQAFDWPIDAIDTALGGGVRARVFVPRRKA